MVQDILVGLFSSFIVILCAEHFGGLSEFLCRFWARFLPEAEREARLEEWLADRHYLGKPLSRLLQALGIGFMVLPKALARSSVVHSFLKITPSSPFWLLLLNAQTRDIWRIHKLATLPTGITICFVLFFGGSFRAAFISGILIGAVAVAVYLAVRNEKLHVSIVLEKFADQRKEK